jgi:hypothetical protein
MNETVTPHLAHDFVKIKNRIALIHETSVATYGVDPKKSDLMHNALHLLTMKQHNDVSWKHEEKSLSVIQNTLA